jgi:hypothetical protein
MPAGELYHGTSSGCMAVWSGRLLERLLLTECFAADFANPKLKSLNFFVAIGRAIGYVRMFTIQPRLDVDAPWQFDIP